LVAERGGIDAIIEGDLDYALARAKAGVDEVGAKELRQEGMRAYARSKEPTFASALPRQLRP